MKKLVKVIAVVTMVTTMFTSTASAVKMYSPDGRTASVMESDVAAWKAKGWSTKNYKTMYAPYGRTAKVLLPDVKAWKKVGWYEVPVTVVSTQDGRTEIIAQSSVDAWRKVGWYENLVKKDINWFVRKAKQELGIPSDLECYYKIGNIAGYWDVGEIWLNTVEFYSPITNEMVACAYFDIEKGEPVRNIWMFTEEYYY